MNTIMSHLFLFIFLFTFIGQMVVAGCGSSDSNKSNHEESDSSQCNNLAQYLVHENQLDDLIDLLSYDRELVLTEDVNGWTPLHEAARHGNPLMVYFLVVNGVDALAKTDKGHTALEIARASIPQSVPDDDDVVINFKLSRTILEKAVKGKGLNDQIINKEAILESGEVIRDMPGLASALALFELVDQLGDLCDLNPSVIEDSDKNGWTPLHEAARKGNPTILELLLQEGADASKMTNDGKTALDVARIFFKTADDKEAYEKVMRLLKLNMKESNLSGTRLSRNLR